MTRLALTLTVLGSLLVLNGCKEADNSGLVLDPARLGQGYGMSMNKSNPGRAEICRTDLGTCRLDPDTPTARTYTCSCFSSTGEKVGGRAE